MHNKLLGDKGEMLAEKFLEKNKYKILEKNFKTKFGEIDLIAKYKENIIFVEVKTRTSTDYGLPCEAVNYKKQSVIGKVAALYLANNKMSSQNCRFDVIEVLVSQNKSNINHIVNAFQLNAF